MTPLANFLPGVLPEGCPHLVAVSAVRDACIELCERSLYLQVDLDAFATVANQAVYTLVAPAGASILSIEGVAFDGEEIAPIGGKPTAEEKAETADAPDGYFVAQHAVLRPYPTINQVVANGLVVTVAVAPAATATEVDDDLYLHFRKAISAGAESQILLMSEKWANPVLGMAKKDIFDTGVRKAQAKVAKGFSNKSLRTVTHFPV